MNPLPRFYLSGRRPQRSRFRHFAARSFMTGVILFSFASGGMAQDVTWSDTFIGGAKPTVAQCTNWTNFLDELGQKTFASVTLSGTFDLQGKSLTDPAAVNELAGLLHARKPGVVTFGTDSWIVTECGSGACGGLSIALSVNGNPSACDCEEKYAVRPQAANANWGGVNSASCSGPSQTMTLKFSSGVSIAASGPTSLCEGESVVLTAVSEICEAPVSYKWSNGETTESITVTTAGTYTVTVSDGNGCKGTSGSVSVELSSAAVDAGVDVEICEQGVQLQAVGTSSTPSGTTEEKVCVFDAEGGDCTFTDDLCSDGSEFVSDRSFSTSVSMLRPDELKFNLYYTAVSKNTTFRFMVNGKVIGTFVETEDSGTCTPGDFGQYPKTFAFSADVLTSWNRGAANDLALEVDSDADGLYFAGIVIDLISSTESYTWSPAEGLSDAYAKNPFAHPGVTTTYTVAFTDSKGCTATDDVEVKVSCSAPPIAVCKNVTVSVGENCQAMVDASAFDGGSTTEKEGALTFTVDPAGPYPVGTTNVMLTVTDKDGEASTCEATVTVTNESPAINSVTPSTSLLYAHFPVSLSVAYTDENIAHATIDWGDGSAVQTVDAPSSPFDIAHTYVNSGSYSVTITLTDACALSTFVYHSIIVMENLRGSVRGGGWFDSPEGALVTNPRAAGKAAFAFEASNTSMKEGPEGHIVFNFKDGNLKFRSTYIDWMHVEEETAILQAAGRLNGKHGYQILISVVDENADEDEDDDTRARKGRNKRDGKNTSDQKDKDKKNVDLIRVKIVDPAGQVVYDTQRDTADESRATTALGGGSIKIKKAKSGFEKDYDSPVASSFGGESSSIYPNPFTEWVDVQFNSASQENVIILVMDLSGKIVYNKIFEASGDGRYTLDIFNEGATRPGVYIVVIKQGKRVEFLRVVAE